MIKTQTAFTAEIDDVDLAVSEILSQLDLGALKKNSVGLIGFYPDFRSSGALKALAEKLPFRTAGFSTVGNSVPGSEGDMILTLMVLSSDDVSFDVVLSPPMNGYDPAPLQSAYRELTAIPGDLKLIISYFPMGGGGLGGDFLVDSLAALAPGLPVFGTLPSHPDSDYCRAEIVCDGEAYNDRCVLIAVKGEVAPRFFIAHISREKLFKDKAVVTAIEGHILKELNHRPAVEYLADNMGLAKTDDGRLLQSEIFPMVTDFNDGSPPIIRAMLDFTEERHIIMAGDVPLGASMSIGVIDAEEVLQTTRKLLRELAASERPDCLMIFSCTARFMTLGLRDQAEIDVTRETLGDFSPYMLAYSGGEICPVTDEKGRWVNRLHNYTFIVCAL